MLSKAGRRISRGVLVVGSMLVAACSTSDFVEPEPASTTRSSIRKLPRFEIRFVVDESAKVRAVEPALLSGERLRKEFKSVPKGTRIGNPSPSLRALASRAVGEVVEFAFYEQATLRAVPSAVVTSGRSASTAMAVTDGVPRRTMGPQDWEIQYPVDWESTEPWTNTYTSAQIAEIAAPIIAEMADTANATIGSADASLLDNFAYDTTGIPAPSSTPFLQSTLAAEQPQARLEEQLRRMTFFHLATEEEDDPCIDQRENIDVARAAVALIMIIGPPQVVAGPAGALAAYGEMALAGYALRITVRQFERCKSRNSGPGQYYQRSGSW